MFHVSTASHCVERSDDRHRQRRRDLRKHRKVHQAHLSVRRIPLHYWNSAKPAQRARLANDEACGAIESSVQRPEIGRPVGVEKAALEGEQPREHLQEIGERIAANDGIERDKEGCVSQIETTVLRRTMAPRRRKRREKRRGERDPSRQ